MDLNDITFTDIDLKIDEPKENTDSETQDVIVTWSASQFGQNVIPLRVEVTQSRGFSGISLIGGTGQICDDGKERAKAALERLGWVAPAKKILMSVSPGDVKIDKTHLDLAFCVGLAGVLDRGNWAINVEHWLFAAEVGINGELRPVSGVVAWASAAMKLGLRGIVVADENLEELNCLSAVLKHEQLQFESLGFRNVQDVLNWLTTAQSEVRAEQVCHTFNVMETTFDDMDLTPAMQLVALVAAGGMHSVLLRGTPGTGKSMFAKRIPSILPLMNREEHLYALGLHSSLSSKVEGAILAGIPPFRSPHHYTSVTALLGSIHHPGELSLASGGVLFLDELPEFRRDVLEGLREPLETGEISVSRAQGSHSWQAKILLIAAANNCPCGWSGSKKRKCECTTNKLMSYRQRLSGPLLDRIDLHINMEESQNQFESLFSGSSRELSSLQPQNGKEGMTEKLKQRVLLCRKRAIRRRSQTGCTLNRDIPPRLVLETFGMPKDKAIKLIESLIPKHVSARSLIRCLRVARTIADVDDCDVVSAKHIDMAWKWQAWSAAKMRGEVSPL